MSRDRWPKRTWNYKPEEQGARRPRRCWTEDYETGTGIKLPIP